MCIRTINVSQGNRKVVTGLHEHYYKWLNDKYPNNAGFQFLWTLLRLVACLQSRFKLIVTLANEVMLLVQSVYLPASRTDLANFHRIWWKGVAWATEREIWEQIEVTRQSHKARFHFANLSRYDIWTWWSLSSDLSWILKISIKNHNQCRNMMTPYPDICISATILYNSRVDCWPSAELCAFRVPF